MKNIRIFFEKKAECRYISHLDLNRVMLRAISKSRCDIWRTEGFNRHAYITFALPLSLGFSSTCESMDFRLLDDNADMSEIPDRLNACLPDGIRVYRCVEARRKPADIASASYEIRLEPMDDTVTDLELSKPLRDFLSQDEIPVEKRTKKGTKTVDLRKYILSCEVKDDGMTLTLPAGSVLNINPMLFITAFGEYIGTELYADVVRTGIFTKEGEDFA